MEKSTFEAIARNLDNRLYSGGLHFLIGITGTGKSSICEIIQKTTNLMLFILMFKRTIQLKIMLIW